MSCVAWFYHLHLSYSCRHIACSTGSYVQIFMSFIFLHFSLIKLKKVQL